MRHAAHWSILPRHLTQTIVWRIWLLVNSFQFCKWDTVICVSNHTNEACACVRMCVCMCLFMLGMKFFIKKTILLNSMHSSSEYRNQMALNDLQSRECISLWIRIFIKMNCRCDWMTWVFYEYISILSRHLSDTFGVQTDFVVYTSCHLFHMPIWSLWSPSNCFFSCRAWAYQREWYRCLWIVKKQSLTFGLVFNWFLFIWRRNEHRYNLKLSNVWMWKIKNHYEYIQSYRYKYQCQCRFVGHFRHIQI